LRVFFDNCTSPVLAHVLHALINKDGDEARHIREMAEYGFNQRTSDFEWISRLSEERPKDWIVITSDRLQKHKPERTAWRNAGLKGFVFAPGLQKSSVNQVAALILWRWPDMKQFMELAGEGSLFELPVQRSARFRPLNM
jgi:PIN like domain